MVDKRPTIQNKFFMALLRAETKVPPAEKGFLSTVMYSIAGGMDVKGVPITRESLERAYDLIDPANSVQFESYRGEQGRLSLDAEESVEDGFDSDEEFLEQLRSIAKSRGTNASAIGVDAHQRVAEVLLMEEKIQGAVVVALRSDPVFSSPDFSDDRVLMMARERLANAIITQGHAAGFGQGHQFWEDLGHVKHSEQMKYYGVSSVLDGLNPPTDGLDP